MDKLYFIQFLRAIAAFSVLLVHVGNEVAQSYNLDHGIVTHDLVLGVDLFFIISGFLMVYTTQGWQGGLQDFLRFIKSRARRIIPLYYFYSSLAVIALIFFSSKMSNPGLDFFHIIDSFLFIPSFYPNTESIQPVLRVGWTLNYEMFFYLIFSLGVLFFYKYRVIFCISSISFIYFFSLLYSSDAVFLRFYSNDILFEFVLGMLFCFVYLLIKNRFYIFVIIYSFVSLILLSILDFNSRFFSYGLFASIIFLVSWLLFFLLPVNEFFLKVFVFIGEASYSVYLSHLFVIVIFNLVFFEIFGWIDVYTYFVIAVFFTFSSCLVLYVVLERFFINKMLLSRYLR